MIKYNLLSIHRYWGKILGIKRNYFVLECEWNNEELEYQLKVKT